MMNEIIRIKKSENDTLRTQKFDLQYLSLQQFSTPYIFLLRAHIEDPFGGIVARYTNNIHKKISAQSNG